MYLNMFLFTYLHSNLTCLNFHLPLILPQRYYYSLKNKTFTYQSMFNEELFHFKFGRISTRP